jgi:glycosyltransferase involved in cell wall biosynthesis
MKVFRQAWIRRIRQILVASRHDAPPDAALSPRMMTIWHERPDLQAAFPLTKEKGRVAAFWWFYCHAFREMGFAYDASVDGASAPVNRPIPNMPQHGFVPITWLMRELWRRRGRHSFGPLKRPIAQNILLAEYFSFRLMDANLGGFLDVDQAKCLCADDPAYPGTPRLLTLIHSCDKKAQTSFSSPADPAFHLWCRLEGAVRYPILAHPLVNLGRIPPPSGIRRPEGINLVGYAHARLGIAEDVRMAAKALTAVDIPFVIHNVSLTPAMEEHEEDLASLLSDDLPYSTNLFCMAAPGMIAAMLSRPGYFGDGRVNIGMWPWELPQWPDFWRHAYQFVDEIWAASAFAAGAYRLSSPKPVRHLPMAVTVDESEGLRRKYFGLPENRFLFSFTFDALSTFARKNPSAVIAAFRKAFPTGTESVGLVLKGMRAEGNSDWQTVLDQIVGDDRIHVITASMRRGELLDLYRNVDCFVSLHRSEGFGRNIAENMALGKPVIVTAHSGNMDFTNEQTAALVRFDSVRVQPGEYPFGVGQQWASPDVDHAARAMRRMVEDASWGRGIAAAGRRFMQEHHSPEAVGRAWQQALKDGFHKPAKSGGS